MKLGIISDTHITSNTNQDQATPLINQLMNVFKDADRIVHAGDICEPSFLSKLESIAPVSAVKGEGDKLLNLDQFIKISVSQYNIGIIHELPGNLEEFM
ncbi:MAG: metallophosphoesterase family protein, partial [Candidatus Hermodarchaeota archaeon]